MKEGMIGEGTGWERTEMVEGYNSFAKKVNLQQETFHQECTTHGRKISALQSLSKTSPLRV